VPARPAARSNCAAIAAIAAALMVFGVHPLAARDTPPLTGRTAQLHVPVVVLKL